MKKLFSSRVVFFLLCALFVLNRFWTPWGPTYDNGRMIQWDTYGYYLYLPAFFIYDDPGPENRGWTDTLYARYKPTEVFYQVTGGKDNKLSIKYPCGMAILWSPFFFVADVIAEPLGYPADGLSPPYSWCILIGGIIYAFIGLWFLRKVLLHFFSDTIAAILLLLITLGTNYWSMAASETVMPHGTLFALNCVVLWLIIRWHEERTYTRTFLLALLMGIGVLARPTQVFWLIVPLLWNVSSWQTLKAKLRMLWMEKKKILAFMATFTALMFIQLWYWKYSTGNWLSYSYQERFAWTSPFLLQCFFSFKKGWFIYTPLMIFCFAGFYFLWKKRREVFWALAVFVFVHTWIIFSWECWWYATSFSQRGALDMYAAMTIPLGFLLVHLSENKKWYRIPVIAIICFCFVLNIFQTWQYNHGIINGDRMTAEYYWRVFGKTVRDEADEVLLEVDHWPNPEVIPEDGSLKLTDTYYFTFEKDGGFTDEHIVDTSAFRGISSYRVDPAFEFGPIYRRPFHGTSGEYEWVKATVWMKLDSALRPGQQPPLLTMSFNANGRALKWKATPLDTARLQPGEWRMVRIEMMTPISLYSDDEITCVVWHPGKTAVYLDDFFIEVYEPDQAK